MLNSVANYMANKSGCYVYAGTRTLRHTPSGPATQNGELGKIAVVILCSWLSLKVTLLRRTIISRVLCF